MLLSSLVTPFKWYDKYYDQNRFDNDCNSVCEFKLITDSMHLIPFQFKRPKSPFLMTNWILREACADPNKKMLSEVDSNFVSESMSWIDVNIVDMPTWNVNCNGGVCAITGNEGEYSETRLVWTGLTIGKTYTYNIIVSKYVSTGSILTFSNGVTILKTFPSAGVFTGTFVANSTEVSFAFSLISAAEEAFCIQYIQIEQAFEILSDDVILTIPGFIRYFNRGADDYFIYCGTEMSSKLPIGDYYSIMEDEGGNLYYSEVITIEDFVPEKSPYLLFEWWNTCDLKDVIYHSVIQYGLGCSYINKLYLPDGVLTRPTYPFKEEGKEDGNATFTPTFQKMDKTVSLIAGRCPEFIIDSLNTVRLHDTIQYKKPLRCKQELIDNAIPVISAECETNYIFNDCFANVELKLLLDEKFVDETCCIEIEKDECMGCLEAGDLNVFDADVYEWALILSPEGSDEPGGLYWYNGSAWVTFEADEELIICTHDSGSYQYQPENPLGVSTYGYVSVPQITYFAQVSGAVFNVRGSINSHGYGMVQYSTDGGFVWIDTTPKFSYTDIFTNFPVTLQGIPCCGTFLVRITNFDLNGCDYGQSEPIEIDSPTNDCC